ncbi:MAG: O-methyltransferase [Nitrosomonas sp.]|nr:MAG: O-methyltransferase [Nitrosomonas sp.]
MKRFEPLQSELLVGLIPVNPAIECYMQGLIERRTDSVLVEMEALAKQKNFPIVGRLVGTSLEVLAKMINAKRVFEFGSGYGYSAYWFARAVGLNGQVICTDNKLANKEQAEIFLSSVDLWKRVTFYIGYAQAVFSQTEGFFDICYNDVDKSEYPSVWKMAREKIKPGGLYIADNVLWHGKVIAENNTDEWTQAILEHNQLIFDDPEFDAFINPTRDGVMVARRKMA